MAVDYYCTEEMLDHAVNDCNEEIPGGINAVVFVDSGVVISDPTDAAEIQQIIADGEAVLIQDVKMAVAEPEPVNVPSNIACEPDKTTIYNHTATLIDGNINATNIALYDQLKYRRMGSMLVFECGDSDNNPKVTYYRSKGDSALKLYGGRVITETDEEFQHFSLSVAWKAKNEGTIHNQPNILT